MNKPFSNEQKIKQDVNTNDGQLQGIVSGGDTHAIQITHNNYGDRQFSSSTSPETLPQENKSEWLGNIIEKDHKYEGRLAYIDLGFAKNQEREETDKIEIRLSITFGQVEEEFEHRNSFRPVKKGYIKFGIKYGELCLRLPSNIEIPLRQRILNQHRDQEWQITSVGEDKAPIWQFMVKEKANLEILQGMLTDENLASFAVLNPPFDVEGVFEVKVNRNNLKIIAQDGVWEDNTNKRVQETKIAAFFKKVVKPKLKEYVSKVVLRYD